MSGKTKMLSKVNASAVTHSVLPFLQGDDSIVMYDLCTDPYQYTEVSASHPDIAETMYTKLLQYAAEQVDSNKDSDKEDAAVEKAAESGYWGPWLTMTSAQQELHPDAMYVPGVEIASI